MLSFNIFWHPRLFFFIEVSEPLSSVWWNLKEIHCTFRSTVVKVDTWFAYFGHIFYDLSCILEYHLGLVMFDTLLMLHLNFSKQYFIGFLSKAKLFQRSLVINDHGEIRFLILIPKWTCWTRHNDLIILDQYPVDTSWGIHEFGPKNSHFDNG